MLKHRRLKAAGVLWVEQKGPHDERRTEAATPGWIPRNGVCVPLHGLSGRQGSRVAWSSQTRRGRGRADGTTSRARLKEKLLPRRSQLPGPVVTLCGYQPSTAAGVTQGIRLPRLQAGGRRDSPAPRKREAWVGTPRGKLLSAASSALLLCGLFGPQLSQDPALISLQARPAVFTNSQEGESRGSKVNLGTGSGRRASIRFLNQVNLGNPNSSA